jgi:hypothetical protein
MFKSLPMGLAVLTFLSRDARAVKRRSTDSFDSKKGAYVQIDSDVNA